MQRLVFSLAVGFGFGVTFSVASEDPVVRPSAPLADNSLSGDLLSSYPSVPGEELLSGLKLGALTSVFYDSNPGQAPGTDESPEEGSLAFTFSPSLGWRRDDSKWRTELNAKAGYNEYLDGDSYSGGSYALGASAAYDGGRWDLVSRFRHSYSDGVNRYYAASVSQKSYGAGLEATYDLSPKTSVRASWDSSWSVPDGGFGETENHVASLSALWRYSSLLRFGPGIAIRNSTGDLQQSRNSIGPILSAAYQLSKKVSIDGSVGLDFTRYDAGGGDHFVSSRIAAVYELDRLWSFNASFVRAAEADGSLAGGFRETTGIRLGVNRKIRRMSASFGLGYEHSAYPVEDGGVERSDVDYLTADLSLSFPIWADRASGLVFLRQQHSGSDDLTRDWDAMQAGFSLSLNF